MIEANALPLPTANPVFKVTPLFDAKYLTNGYRYGHGHRLRGSASTVLTATGQVNRRWQLLIPYRIVTPEPIAKKFRTIDYVYVHPLGASGQMGEI